MKTFTLLLMALILAACSIEISDTIPTASPPGAATTRTPSIVQTPTIASPIPLPPSPTPLPWVDLNLTGRLYFLTFTRGAQELVTLDLASGSMATVFQPESKAWLTAADVSPDGTQIVMAYAPPPAEGQVQFGYTDLYLMPTGASGRLTPLLERAEAQEAYFNPVWSPDGAHIYFVHTQAISIEAGITFKYTLERLAYPGGEPEALIENAIWPRLSPDGSKLAYVTFDPETYTNDLYVADADGANSVAVLPPETFLAVDAPLFSPDGTRVIFSAVSLNPTPPLSWLDQLLGVQSAAAHSIPSDWWSVPVTGGQPERLTAIFDTGMYADVAPDGQRLIFVSATGLYVMNPDGSDLQRLLNIWTGGTVDWAP